MNSYRRTMAAINGEAYDRTPVIPLIIQNALHISATPHNLYSRNAKKMAEAQINALNKYGYDGIHITTDNQIISEVLGCEINFPIDEPPQYRSRILQFNSDLTQLMDFDPYTAGRMPVIINATQIAVDELKDKYFIKVNCDSGPFSIASALRGEQNFFLDLFDNEQYVFDLLEICTKAVVKYAKALVAAGAHGITFGDSTAGLISRELYEKFALPFERKLIREITSVDTPTFMHICGKTSGIIDLMAKSGADVLEIDSLTDLDYAFDVSGGKICLEGNINPTEILLQGTRLDVYNESLRCIKSSLGRNFILSSGCEIPRFTSKENICAMVEASENMRYF